MPGKRSAPPVLAVLTVMVCLGMLLSREVFRSGNLPVFSPQEEKLIHIGLSGASLLPGVYQFNDGFTLRDVMKLTVGWEETRMAPSPILSRPLNDGESLRIVKKDRQIKLLHRGWLPAGQRMALGVPLHPDRMSLADWIALPGIGPQLAQRIENDRQKNGDFGGLNTLSRVPGIGRKRLNQWRGFFENP